MDYATKAIAQHNVAIVISILTNALKDVLLLNVVFLLIVQRRKNVVNFASYLWQTTLKFAEVNVKTLNVTQKRVDALLIVLSLWFKIMFASKNAIMKIVCLIIWCVIINVLLNVKLICMTNATENAWIKIVFLVILSVLMKTREDWVIILKHYNWKTIISLINVNKAHWKNLELCVIPLLIVALSTAIFQNVRTAWDYARINAILPAKLVFRITIKMHAYLVIVIKFNILPVA